MLPLALGKGNVYSMEWSLDFGVAKVERTADVMCVCVRVHAHVCVTDPSLLQDYIKLGHTHTHTHHNCTPFYFCHSKI